MWSSVNLFCRIDEYRNFIPVWDRCRWRKYNQHIIPRRTGNLASSRKMGLRQIKGLSQGCGMSVVHNPNIQKAESGGSLCLRQFELYSEFQASMNYIRRHFQNKRQNPKSHNNKTKQNKPRNNPTVLGVIESLKALGNETPQIQPHNKVISADSFLHIEVPPQNHSLGFEGEGLNCQTF